MEHFSQHENLMFHRLLHENRLSRSIKARSHPFVMERIVEVLLKRWWWWQQQQQQQHNDITGGSSPSPPPPPPPLRVAVFGGSVTEGFRSRFNKIGMDTSNMHDLPLCAWSYKLEKLLNEVLPLILFGPDRNSTSDIPLVEVKNFAVSGTDSSIGVTLLEYDMLGADLSGMDVVISAFAANDLQVPLGLERDLISLHMQRFHRVAKAGRPCSDLPLLIQLADVMEESFNFNGLTQIRNRLRYANEMLETANWQTSTSGIMALSYPDAVRDVVYRNQSNDTLIEFAELHPGLTFHSGIAWMIAYGLVDGILQSCDASSLEDHDRPEPRAGILLPSLRDDLHAGDIPGKWKDDMVANQERCEKNQTSPTRCAYQMIAHRLGAATKEQVTQMIDNVATNIDGWEGHGFPVRKPRRTWRALYQNATFTIELQNLEQPINRFLVLVCI